MTKKDYERIARALKQAAANMTDAGLTNHSAHVAWTECAATIADELAADNSRFDRARFLAACEVAS